jgi:lipopolysaccharide exporter
VTVPDRSRRFSRAHLVLRLARARLLRDADRSFLQPVLTLITGTAVAHAVALAGRPVLTRLFDANAFGVLTVFLALSAVITAFSAGRYEDALMLPRRRALAANVLSLALVLTTASAAILLLILPFESTISAWLGGTEMAPAIRWLPAAVLFLGTTLVFESWHTRGHRYGMLSIGRSLQSGVTVAVQIGAGVLALGAVGLVAGATAGFAVAALVFAVGAWVYDRRLARALSVRWMRRAAGRYRHFPSFSAPASFLNTLASRAPALLMAILFTAEVVGYFGVAFGTLALPVGLATAAIGQVFFVRAAEALRHGDIAALTLSVYRRLLVISIFPMLVVIAAGPLLFGFVFGPGWETAGEYARWLAPWLLFAAVAPPLTRIFDVLERQRADLGFSTIMFAIQGTVFVLAGLLTDPLTTLALGSMAGALLRIAHIGFMLRLAAVSLRTAGAVFLRLLALALPPIALVIAVQAATGSGPATLASALAAGMIYLALAQRVRLPS